MCTARKMLCHTNLTLEQCVKLTQFYNGLFVWPVFIICSFATECNNCNVEN